MIEAITISLFFASMFVLIFLAIGAAFIGAISIINWALGHK